LKLGFVSAVMAGYTFEEVIDFASQQGFNCVEMACWPQGKAERRYAGVAHIDVDTLDDEKITYIQNYCAQRNVAISSLAYYPNTMDGDLEKRSAVINHLKKVILASHRLGIDMVTTFVGRVTDKNVDENIKIFKEVWEAIVELAEENHVKIAIENCPMLFTNDEWPGGQNLATTPTIWRELFSIIKSDYLGLNFDPSHFVWQQMDYIKPIYEFHEKIFHVHFKDIKILKDRLDDVGIMATPLSYMVPKLPGLGDVNWGKFVSALTDIGYDGYACIEVEDKAFEKTPDDILNSIKLSNRYMRQFVI